MTQRMGAFALAAGLALAVSAPAAAADLTYVSAAGKDTWPCTRDKPCRTFAVALLMTDPGGTLVALDSARYSDAPLVIDKAVSIEAAPGARAELTAPTSGAVFVNAGVADVVVLRGLSFFGQPMTPNNAIVLNSAQALHVENCVVSGFPTKGILSLSLGELYVADSVFRGAFVGISLDAATKASIVRTRLEDNEFGLVASFGAQATVEDTVASGNSNAGFLGSTIGSPSDLTVERSVAANNGTGIRAEGFSGGVATVRVSASVVSGNATGLRQAAGGVLESRGNNTVRGNGTDVSGVVTPIAGT